MTFPEEMTMFCTICGGPIHEEGIWTDSPKWLEAATLLYPKSGKNESPEDIAVGSATNTGGPYFLLDSGSGLTKVTACDSEINNIFAEVKPTLYIPLHTVCFRIINEVAATASPAISYTTALITVWKILHARFLSSSKNRFIPSTLLYDLHGFYGIGRFQELSWEPGTSEESIRLCGYYEADPAGIPDPTEALLSDLQALPTNIQHSFITNVSSTSLSSLPNEILQSIICHLRPLSDEAQTCTYVLPPPYWRQALLDGTVLPWLPQLDAGRVNAKEAQATNGVSWDWERLVRRLAALPFREGPSTVSAKAPHVPTGVWNRRRIWQLAENMLGLSTVHEAGEDKLVA